MDDEGIITIKKLSCWLFILAFLKAIPAHTLWFDDIRSEEAMSLYCQGKAKTAHARRDDIEQTQSDEWDELGNTWLLLPVLYTSPDQRRDELDGAFELIEKSENSLGEDRKTMPTSAKGLRELAEGKRLKYNALAMRKSPFQGDFQAIAQIWSEAAAQNTDTFDAIYQNARRKASEVKEGLRMKKFGGNRPPLGMMKYSLLYPFIGFTLNIPHIHLMRMECLSFARISPSREIKSGEYQLWSKGLKKFQSDYVADLQNQKWLGWLSPPDQDTNDKWMNRRALIAFTRHFLKLDRKAAFKALDSMALL